MSLPLDGLVVVAFEQAVAAPMCTRNLGDLGARVIKIEHPRGGDFTREFDDVVNGMSSMFVWINRNKESLSLDARTPEGAAVLDRLLPKADIVVQNFAPGAARRLGVDAETLVERFPRLIAVDISGYGVGGPYDHKRAYDLLVQSEAGSCSITGTPGAPAKPGIAVADVGTGLYAFSSILAALYQREKSGQGAAIAISLFDVITDLMGFALQYTMATGEERPPNGLSSPAVAPYGGYPTSDGKTVVLGTTNDAEWQRLCLQVLDRPDLAADERYRRNVDRCKDRATLDAAITSWARQRTLAEIQQIADDAGIGNGTYNEVRDVIDHPQLHQRGRWVDIESPAGTLRELLSPPIVSGWDQRTDAVPAVGQHTDAILTELGYDASAIGSLHASGVV
ncbi:MAG: itaconate CoA-transferase [Frankiales bacterium]|jgi:crotonobetainyl-CoA:carnitine CoA-transferase CaiB-like acyl-CoA transferase|nr:itaconate CoA-transferase [Frankiales bacterium]